MEGRRAGIREREAVMGLILARARSRRAAAENRTLFLETRRALLEAADELEAMWHLIDRNGPSSVDRPDRLEAKSNA